MITVHHLNQSRSLRIVWLLEELGVPYELKTYQRDAKTMLAPSALKAIHPLGKAPIVVDDGIVMIESGAIITLLLERHGADSGLSPDPGTSAHRDYLTFLHFAEGSMMPPLLLRLIFTRIASGSPTLLRPLVKAITRPINAGFIDPNITRTLDFLEGELGKRLWFAGDAFSAADIQMSFPVEMARSRGGLDQSRPKLMDFLARIRARPAHARALAKVGE